MKTYTVTIRATVTKTLTVEADDDIMASELAHQQFDVATPDLNERYTQETLAVEEQK